ncbi:hypothetical protein ACFWA5_35270 [Streptomyces mirabilis]
MRYGFTGTGAWIFPGKVRWAVLLSNWLYRAGIPKVIASQIQVRARVE